MRHAGDDVATADAAASTSACYGCSSRSVIEHTTTTPPHFFNSSTHHGEHHTPGNNHYQAATFYSSCDSSSSNPQHVPELFLRLPLLCRQPRLETIVFRGDNQHPCNTRNVHQGVV